MSKRRKGNSWTPKEEKGCENCANAVPVGECAGDHACNASVTMPVVIANYIPTTKYLLCNGRKWVCADA